MYWQTSRFQIDLESPKIMGIVNVTPDSFSDGGHYETVQAACAHCEQLVADGAHILDIGAESTRPGAQVVSVEVELARIVPVLRHAVTLGVPVSVDTYKPAVMQVALDLGVDIINDIWALRWPGDAQGRLGLDVVAAHSQCGICVMHMHRDPATMQVAPMTGDVISEVMDFLHHQVVSLRAAGVAPSRICLDPGVGFGKTVAQNFSLLARQIELLRVGYPLLVGWSRKSSLKAVAPPIALEGTPENLHERVVPSITAALLAVSAGAHIVRVHDVRETAQALMVYNAMQAQRLPAPNHF